MARNKASRVRISLPLLVGALIVVGISIAAVAVITRPSPAKFEVISLAYSPTEAEVGLEVTIYARVKNVGGTMGTYEATLKINGEEVEVKEVTLALGETKTITFAIVKNIEGDYTIGVGGLTRSLIVKKISLWWPENLRLELDKTVYEEYDTIDISVTNLSDRPVQFPVSNIGGGRGPALSGAWVISIKRWRENAWIYYDTHYLLTTYLSPSMGTGTRYKLGLTNPQRSFPPGRYRVECYGASAEFEIVPRSHFIGTVLLDNGMTFYRQGENVIITLENPSSQKFRFHSMRLKRWNDVDKDWELVKSQSESKVETIDNRVTITLGITLGPGENTQIALDLTDLSPSRYLVVLIGDEDVLARTEFTLLPATEHVSGEELEELVKGKSEFAFELYQKIRDSGGNLFYSPYSISLALAMTYAGARGETERQMADTLNFTLPQERLHPAFNALDQSLADRERENFVLNIANAFWSQENFHFKDEFLDTLALNYGASVRLLDFIRDPESARATINEWVENQTENKIEDLIPQGVINQLTRAVLTNAIYFNAAWKYPFPEGATRNDNFTLLDGKQVIVPMMSQTGSFRSAKGDGYQAIELPYQDENMSMLIILPTRNQFEKFEETLTAERVGGIVDDLKKGWVSLTMPKFKFETYINLSGVLADMGMPAAFNPEEADFSGMTGDRSLFIHEVLHKAFVSVDEEGTEAAAATAVVMGVTSLPPQISLDSPFIFMIRDNETGAILFMGRVLDPTA